MRRALVIGGVTLLLAACADAGSGSSDDRPSPLQPGDLDGRTFVSTAVDGYDLVEGTQVSISFDGDRLSASAGCNTLNAPYAVDEGALTLPSDPSSTQIGCDPALATQDGWLASFLADGPSARIDGDTLTLTGGEVTMDLLDASVADPARSLTDTLWTLGSIVENDAVSSVPAGVDPPTLRIGGDGEASVFTGCNQGGASVDITDDTIAFGPMRLTKMACEGDATTVETTVLGVLAGPVDYTIEGSALTLTNGDRGLVYDAG